LAEKNANNDASKYEKRQEKLVKRLLSDNPDQISSSNSSSDESSNQKESEK